jgi:cytochrome-b5 reductase
MGRHITGLKVGDSLKLKGPWKKLEVTPNKYKSVGLVAGGTGLTPMLQVVNEVLGNPNDSTKMTLIYGNQTPDDILLKPKLDELAAAHPSQLKVVYTVDRPTNGWSGETGFVTADMVRKHLPSAQAENTMIMVCGPPPMMKGLCGPKGPKGSQGEIGGVLKDVGFTIEQCYKF